LSGDAEGQGRPVGGAEVNGNVVVDGNVVGARPCDVDAVAALVHGDPLPGAGVQDQVYPRNGLPGFDVDANVAL
jgi:hypothetical protein